MTTMSTLSLRQRLSEYEKLMRLDKPIGILLLLWPTLWALWRCTPRAASSSGSTQPLPWRTSCNEKRPQRERMRAVSELSSVSQPRIPRGACQAAIRKGSRPGK